MTAERQQAAGTTSAAPRGRPARRWAEPPGSSTPSSIQTRHGTVPMPAGGAQHPSRPPRCPRTRQRWIRPRPHGPGSRPSARAHSRRRAPRRASRSSTSRPPSRPEGGGPHAAAPRPTSAPLHRKTLASHAAPPPTVRAPTGLAPWLLLRAEVFTPRDRDSPRCGDPGTSTGFDSRRWGGGSARAARRHAVPRQRATGPGMVAAP